MLDHRAHRSPAARSGLKLHLGCGRHFAEGWINIDNSPGLRLAQHPRLQRALHALIPRASGLLPDPRWQAGGRHHDLTRPLPFEDGSAAHVYASHVLEHLSPAEAAQVLRESFRVLEPGGIIRVIVPDFAALVAEYVALRETSPELACEKFHHDSGFFDYPPPRGLSGLVAFHFRRRHNHAFLYDEPTLRARLRVAGFQRITRRGVRDSAIPDVAALDVDDRFRGALCLEAEKPPAPIHAR